MRVLFLVVVSAFILKLGWETFAQSFPGGSGSFSLILTYCFGAALRRGSTHDGAGDGAVTQQA
jgi:hypothetical protein